MREDFDDKELLVSVRLGEIHGKSGLIESLDYLKIVIGVQKWLGDFELSWGEGSVSWSVGELGRAR